MSITRFSRYYPLDTVIHRGRVSLAQRIDTPKEPQAGSLVHTLLAGETLDSLAAHYYGRADLWWKIADYNPGRFPLDWVPGEKLIIPPIRLATRTPPEKRYGG